MSQTMQSVAVVPGSREVRLVGQPIPDLQSPTDVKLRILEVGVCGTDREICAFDYGTPPPGSDHLVIGHESLGEVEDIGSGVTGIEQGDLVVPMVRRPCPHEHCRACRAGRQDFCFTGDIRERGIKEAHGFMTEFVVDDARYMNVVPKALRPVAVLVEPLTIAEKALIQLWGLQERLPWDCPHSRGGVRGHCHRAVVLGAGPVGLLGAMAFAAAGFETSVYSAEPEDHPKAELIRSFGARFVSARTHSMDQLRETVGNIDLAYEAAGNSRVAFDLLRVVGTNGIFVMTGVPGHKGPAPVDTDGLMRNVVLKNQIVLGTVNAGRDAFEAAIRDLGIFLNRWPGAQEPAGEEVVPLGVLAIDPPGEVEQQLVEDAGEEDPVALAPRARHLVDAPAGPRVHGRVHVPEGELVGGDLPVGVHVPLAQEQHELVLRELGVDPSWRARTRRTRTWRRRRCSGAPARPDRRP